MRVYNKGTAPIVYHWSYRSKLVIHPGKYIETDEKQAKQIIADHEHAVDEKTFTNPDAPAKRGRPPKEES